MPVLPDHAPPSHASLRCPSQVIFRDFKTTNILLDAHGNAKLSDFGLARYGPQGEDKSHVTTRVSEGGWEEGKDE